MRFKEMTDEDIQYFTEVYKNKKLSWDERMLVLMEFTGKSERTVIGAIKPTNMDCWSSNNRKGFNYSNSCIYNSFSILRD